MEDDKDMPDKKIWKKDQRKFGIRMLSKLNKLIRIFHASMVYYFLPLFCVLPLFLGNDTTDFFDYETDPNSSCQIKGYKTLDEFANYGL